MAYIFLAFVALLFINGNIMLFSGELVSMMSDNDAAWLFVLLIVAADFYVVYHIVKSVSASQEAKRIQAEQNRVEMLKQEIKQIVEKNTPANRKMMGTPIALKIDSKYLNQEVIETVKTYRESMRETYAKLDHINGKLRCILSCEGRSDLEERVAYLKDHLSEIEKLKAQSDELKAELLKCKIKLLGNDEKLQTALSLAFRHLQNSEKCLSSGIGRSKFFPEKLPQELEIFEFEGETAVFRLDGFYFCLMSNVILVFDKNGLFSTAVNPVAMKIDVKKENERVTVRDGTPNFGKYTASDSRCVVRGVTRTSWLHSCRDGSPDLRYSYNPRFEYRTDTYEYTILRIQIVNQEVTYYVSSQAASEAFEDVTTMYVCRSDAKLNLVPEFIALLRLLCHDDARYISAFDEYEKNYKPKTYFCELVER